MKRVSVCRINRPVITEPGPGPLRTALNRPGLRTLASATSIPAFRGAFCLRLRREQQIDEEEDDEDDEDNK